MRIFWELFGTFCGQIACGASSASFNRESRVWMFQAVFPELGLGQKEPLLSFSLLSANGAGAKACEIGGS